MKILTLVIIILSVVTVSAVGVTIWAVFIRDPEPAPEPDYPQQQTETNAKPIEGENDTEKLEQAEGGGAVSLTYSKLVTISLSSREASLMFQNPSKSNQNIVLELSVGGNTVAVSGRIDPGFKVDQLSGIDTDGLTAGTYDGKFVIGFYDADSGEKAMLNTEIPVTVTVTD